jgi:hypothetical protein
LVYMSVILFGLVYMSVMLFGLVYIHHSCTCQ